MAGHGIQDPPLTGDNGCPTVNNTSIEVPWAYAFKGASTGGFYEGGVNLSQIGQAGCFSSFPAETRSSPARQKPGPSGCEGLLAGGYGATAKSRDARSTCWPRLL